MKLTGQKNKCSICGSYFNSNLAFDKHRTGVYGLDRRCLTHEEMRAKGMAIAKSGFWVTELHTKGTLARVLSGS